MATQPGILNMFARSPMRPLQQHMEKAHRCAELLMPFFQSVLNNDWESAQKLRQDISNTEREADDLKMKIRLNLPKKLFLPVPRSDLLALLSKQEKIANTAKDISGIMIGRKMEIPSALAEHFTQYLQRAIDATQQANLSISELDELLESGFRGKEVRVVEKLIQELNKIEHDTDTMQIALRESLFALENTLKPVDVMFLYKIIEWIGLLADCAQKAGARLRTLTAD